MTMKLGEVAKITIAGYKGYGANGFPAWGYPFNTVQPSLVEDVPYSARGTYISWNGL